MSGEELWNSPLNGGDPAQQSAEKTEAQPLSSLTICADDIIHVLDALSQQYNDPIMSSSLSVFSSQYHTANNGFRRLRNELLMLQEPGSSSTSIHPCQENWLVVPILPDGRPGRPESCTPTLRSEPRALQASLFRLEAVDIAQHAAVRLVLEDPAVDGSTILGISQRDLSRKSLVEIFRAKARSAWKSADNIDELYWDSAADYLEATYPSSSWGHDSRVLRPLLRQLGASNVESWSYLESQIAMLEVAYSDSKRSLLAASKRLHLLKVRLWYETSVINSSEYDEAKNIARALNYMALPTEVTLGSAYDGSSDIPRPGTGTSTASSMFEQSRVDTVNMLKAPREHGGSKKLADQQVEMTKKWLSRYGVENFCKGEERIHRFCMEIKMTTRKLVGETFAESPVLWSSGLWAKEKTVYDIGTMTAFSVSSSTRPPSVMSETLSSTHFPLRPPLGSLGFSTRSLDVDVASSQGRKTSFYSLNSHRLNRDLLGSDFAPSLSPGQSLTATSGESVSSMWSPLPSQRSVTSASLPSRAPSIMNDLAGFRGPETSIEKAKFLDDLQHDLITLLLSDLGNPVWCQGSETDTWVGQAKQNPNIIQRLDRQQQISRLLPELSRKERTKFSPTANKRPSVKRRTWSAETVHGDKHAGASPQNQIQSKGAATWLPDDRMVADLQDILSRISYHIDPRMKLDTVHEFKVLAMQAYPKRADGVTKAEDTKPVPNLRRRGTSVGPDSDRQPINNGGEHHEPQTQNEITDWLKTLLLHLEHRTLFRDLQYIAAFIPADTLNKTEKGRAFLHVGLGALACKDEYCRTMVDLADKIVSKDSIKRRIGDSDGSEEGLLKAKEYWILAAREGNRIAQRELAGLYLAHPEIPPIVSLPMSLSSEVFKNEMKWEDDGGENSNMQSLCLALHWMQQAADNKDQVAIRKLEERKGLTSIR